MKKIFIISTYGDFFWSFEHENINILKKYGYRIYLIANFVESKYNHKLEEISKLDVEMIDVPFARSPFNIATLKNYLYLKKIIKKEKPALIDCHLAVVGVLTRLACWNNKNVKIIYSPHGFFFYKGCSSFNKIVYQTVENIMASRTDALITINAEDYENAKHMNVRGKIYKVPGVGVDVKAIYDVDVKEPYLRKLIGVEQDELIFMSVGELSKNKNHIIMIEALKMLANQGINNIHYVICGRDDSERELIEKKVSEYGLNRVVHYLGYRTDIIELNKQSDCFVLLSFKEGLSVSIIEAMACGLPVIASRIRGNVDLVDEGKGGYLFAPSDSDELVECIKSILDQSNRYDFGLYNMKKSEMYSRENVSSMMEKMYKETIGD